MQRKNLLPLTHEVALNRRPPPWGGALYKKVLVPLDRSTAAEDVVPIAQELLSPGGKGILLHVIQRGKPRGGQSDLAAEREEAERAKALGYLRCAQNYLLEASGRWRCEVVVADTVAGGIVDFAIREDVDLIAMHAQGRKGLAGLIKKSLAEKVQRRGPVNVRVLRPREPVAR